MTSSQNVAPPGRRLLRLYGATPSAPTRPSAARSVANRLLSSEGDPYQSCSFAASLLNAIDMSSTMSDGSISSRIGVAPASREVLGVQS